jgi:hypothetical protein
MAFGLYLCFVLYMLLPLLSILLDVNGIAEAILILGLLHIFFTFIFQYLTICQSPTERYFSIVQVQKSIASRRPSSGAAFRFMHCLIPLFVVQMYLIDLQMLCCFRCLPFVYIIWYFRLLNLSCQFLSSLFMSIDGYK